jgi:hypothetical protein
MTEAKTVEDDITDAVTKDLIRQHDEGHMVTAWVMVGECINGAGYHEPFVITSPQLPWSSTLGLLEIGRLMYRQEFEESDE